MENERKAVSSPGQKGESEELRTLVEVPPSFKSAVPAIQGYCDAESAERLTPFKNQVGEVWFITLLGLHQKQKDVSYVDENITSIDWLSTWVPAMVYYLERKGKHGGHRQKWYAVTYWRTVRHSTEQLISSVWEN